MAKITQNQEEIIIKINLNYITKLIKPDILILKNFVKFNQSPIYFEGFLKNEINENESYCKIFQKEAKIVLKKNIFEIWPEIFENLSKDEIKERKIEINKIIEELNKKKYEEKSDKKHKIKKQIIENDIQRDAKIRNEIDFIKKKSCIQPFEKNIKNFDKFENRQEETKIKVQQPPKSNIKNISTTSRTTVKPSITTPKAIRKNGIINFQFSDYKFKAPKRESQLECQNNFSKND